MPFTFYAEQKRHKADQETNKRQVEVLRGGQWLWLAWQQINVGDVVRVRAGAFFPADLILISSRYIVYCNFVCAWSSILR